MLTRGIRNNNPLNIRRTAKDQWKGLSKTQNDRLLTSDRLSSRSAELKHPTAVMAAGCFFVSAFLHRAAMP